MVQVIRNGRLILSGCLIINKNNELLLLYKKNHKHYETPGGKVDIEECSNQENPTIEDLAKTAEREAYEELGNDIKLKKLKYFGNVEFIIPDGRLAIANKFLTEIIAGKPKNNEEGIFLKIEYLSIQTLERYPLSPDLKLLLPKIKDYIKNR